MFWWSVVGRGMASSVCLSVLHAAAANVVLGTSSRVDAAGCLSPFQASGRDDRACACRRSRAHVRCCWLVRITAGLSCQDKTTVNVTCSASLSCAELDEADVVELLSECTGPVASNSGQRCVYTEQIQDVTTGATWASFSVTNALVAECLSSDGSACDLDDDAQCPESCTLTSNNANVMTEDSVKGKLSSAQFGAIEVGSRPDISNSRPRNLPFCPIAHPEPFPPPDANRRVPDVRR